MPHDNLDIAVTGAGVTAAFLLQQRHRVCLFERNDYVGGHPHTVVIPNDSGAETPVDKGFIVLNNRTCQGYGFHEDAVRSVVTVAAALGGER